MSLIQPSPEFQGTQASSSAERTGVLGYLSSIFWVKDAGGAKAGIFPGWWEVLAGSSHSFFGYGIYIYSWSAVQATLTKQFGWSAAQLGLLGTLTKEEGAIEGAFAGWLVDHFGPKWVAAVSWAMGGLGFLLLPLITYVSGSILGLPATLVWMLFCYGALVSIGMNSALYNTSYKAVNRWFIKNRGLTIGATTWGAGFGSPVLIPVIALLVTTQGWQTAVVFMGILFLTMGVPSSLALYRRHGPEQSGFRPDNEKLVYVPPAAAAAGEGSAVAGAAPAMKEFGVWEALKNRSFWFWTGGLIINGLGGINLPQFQSLRMQEAGFTLEAAALWYALDFIFTAVGRTGESLLGDIVHPRIGYAASYAIQAAGFYCFAALSPGSPWNTFWLIGYVVLHGIGYGYSIPVAGVMVGALFGREWFATIRGLNSALVAAVTLPGPILFGLMRDWSGNYYLPFAYGAAMMALGGFMILFAKTPEGQIEPGRGPARVAH